MKKIILLCAIAFLSGACSDFLDEKVFSQTEAGKMYRTYEEADQAAMGMYKVFSANGGMNSRWQALLTYGTDEARCYYQNAKIDDQFYKVSNFSHTAGDTHITNMWSTIYMGIGLANDVWQKVTAMTGITEERKQPLLAEAAFMRAYLYFTLVQLWGPVRLTTEAPNYDNVVERHVTRASIEKVYEQITTDIEYAKLYLPVTRDSGMAGRPTRYSAYGMAAKIYLTMASGSRFGVAGHECFNPATCYGLAKENAAAVMDDAECPYDLVDDYESVFLMSNKHNPEILFEACFEITGPGSQWPKMGGPKNDGGNTAYSYSTYGPTGRGYLRPSVYLATSVYGVALSVNASTGDVTAESSDDVRYDCNIVRYAVGKNGERVHKNNCEHWIAHKFSLRTSDMAGFTWTTVPMNHPILRFADVLLIYAEAAGMLDLADQSAYDALNRVRQRARRKGTTPEYLKDWKVGDLTDADTFMDAILDERMRELCFEGHRRPDLLRTSRLFKALDRMKAVDESLSPKLAERAVKCDWTQQFYGSNVKAYHVLFPIPQSEMNVASNSDYYQNPGWDGLSAETASGE